MEAVPLYLAFAAGVISFLSPCTLPLVPSFFSYLTGITHNNTNQRMLLVTHTSIFVLGFSFIFIAFGLSASTFGQLLSEHQHTLRKVGSIVIILLGLHMMEILPIPLLYRQTQHQLATRKVSYLRSLLVGLSFSLGWTPCIGPVLASILVVAASSNQTLGGAWLLAIYSLGMGIPFLLTALFWARLQQSLRNVNRFLPLIHKVGGAVMVVVGILMYFNVLVKLSGWFPGLGL